MGQINWIVTFAFAGLFAIAIIGFAFNFADDNNSAVDIKDDAQFTQFYANTTTSVGGFRQDAEDTYTAIINSSIAPEGNTLESSGPLTQTDTNMITTTKNILKISFTRIFGGNSGFNIFLITFLGLIVLITGLLIYKTLIGRNPE